MIEGFAASLPDAEIHVFDNNSTDDTSGIARAHGATVHFVTPRGKGNVVRRMFADVDADVYVMVDGDATYQADIASELVDRLIDGNRDMIVGQRVTEQEAGEEYRSGHVLGNVAFTKLYNVLFQTTFEDVFSGYRVMTRRFVKSFPATTSGFDIETELIVHAAELRVETDEGAVRGVVGKDGSVTVTPAPGRTSFVRVVIDDLVDTGGTAVAIREMYPKAHFVTIFAKPAGRPLVDDYVVDIPQDTWIEQPWDMGVVFVPPIAGR